MPTWVFNSSNSHDVLDIEFPSNKAILDVMASLNNPKYEVMYQSYYPNLELMRVRMMSLDLRLIEFIRAYKQNP
jgi:hypothetical protein